MSTIEGASRAIERGLDYLEGTVHDDGAWPSEVYLSLDRTGDPIPERPPFVAGLGALSMAECASPRAQRLRTRARTFLETIMEYPGVWRYWPTVPPDLDDTAVCSLVVGPHAWLALGRTLPTVFRKRDDQGRFRTWLARGGDFATWDDVDSVVNANVVAWLGDRPETRNTQRWLMTLIDENREDGSSWYYPDPMDLYAALSRIAPGTAGASGILSRLGPKLAARIMARRDEQAGHFGDTQRTAQALSALDRLAAWPTGYEASRAVDSLIESQSADGSWPAGLVWLGPPPPNPPSTGCASAALITAYCLEALERFVRHARSD